MKHIEHNGVSAAPGSPLGAAKARGVDTEVMKEFLYQCRYGELLSELDVIDWRYLNDRQVKELGLLKAAALYEMHRIDESTEALRDVIRANPSEPNDELILYVVARLTYFEGHPRKARDLFQIIFENTKDENFKIRALLGVANTLYSERILHAFDKVVRELESMEPMERLEDRLSLINLQASRAMLLEKDHHKAQQLLSMGLNMASKRGWNYFVLRFLFGLAKIEKEFGSEETLECYLSLLREFVNKNESHFFAYLYNETFKDQTYIIRSPLEIDSIYRRVLINDRWLDLTSKPEVFNLLRFLRNTDGYVSMREIVSFMIPNREYIKEVHDMYIGSLIKEARTLIERHADQPIILLGKGDSYRLACA